MPPPSAQSTPRGQLRRMAGAGASAFGCREHSRRQWGVSCKDVPGGTSRAGARKPGLGRCPAPLFPAHTSGGTFFCPPLAEDWLMPLTFKVLHVVSWEADKEEEKHPSGRAVA